MDEENMIVLPDNYTIRPDVNGNAYVLSKATTRVTKEGEELPADCFCGYFTTVNGAVHKFFEIKEREIIGSENMTLKEAAEKIDKLHKEIKQLFDF